MSLPYRPNVCMLLFNKDGRLFLGERKGLPGEWQLPQGGIDEGASPESSVLRELEEECGIPQHLLRIEKCLESTHRYDFHHPPEYAKDRWRGQEQTFWLVRFLGSDGDINVDTKHPEFSGYRWCTPDEVRATAHEVRLPGYEQPLREFEEFWNTPTSEG